MCVCMHMFLLISRSSKKNPQSQGCECRYPLWRAIPRYCLNYSTFSIASADLFDSRSFTFWFLWESCFSWVFLGLASSPLTPETGSMLCLRESSGQHLQSSYFHWCRRRHFRRYQLALSEDGVLAPVCEWRGTPNIFPWHQNPPEALPMRLGICLQPCLGCSLMLISPPVPLPSRMWSSWLGFGEADFSHLDK